MKTERSRVARDAYNSLAAKSDKERCIRVAAIDMMISAGVWNICRISRNHEKHTLAVTLLANLRDREDLEFQNGIRLAIRTSEEMVLLFKFKLMNTFNKMTVSKKPKVQESDLTDSRGNLCNDGQEEPNETLWYQRRISDQRG